MLFHRKDAVMTGSTSMRAVLAAAALAALAVGCMPSDGGGVSAGSCDDVMEFDHRTYLSVGDVEFTVGAEAGAAGRPPCDDTGGESEEETRFDMTAYEVEGLDTGVAIAVGDSPHGARLYAMYEEDGDLPAEVQKFIGGGQKD
ncbi:putative secreted protein [Streptomyces avermitilis MA-4680 = NBRC 14893]|uniref:Secreted protein n=2 Tax=Streptomyces avermitilis TaxID=33903 RepID=Q82EY3_STRAW|nr:putative secreted protein [Streptomyces avermitilis MA-4680 = NBRC 14893]